MKVFSRIRQSGFSADISFHLVLTNKFIRYEPSLALPTYYCRRYAASLGFPNEWDSVKIGQQPLAVQCYLFFTRCSPAELRVFVPSQTPANRRRPFYHALVGTVGRAGAIVAGLMFVNKVGASTLAGLTITANILMSLLIDKYGWFGMEQHPLSLGRIAGAMLLVVGIYLVSKY